MINNKNNFDENIEEKKYLDTDINILHKNIINNNENHKINIKAKFNDKKLEQNENNNTFNSYIIKKNKLIDNNISLINNIDESIETKANNISSDKIFLIFLKIKLLNLDHILQKQNVQRSIIIKLKLSIAKIIAIIITKRKLFLILVFILRMMKKIMII